MSTQEDPVRLNGRLAARWARRTVERLRRQRNDINAINVFPVPDGDTGTNLYYTVRSAYRAVEGLSGSVTLPEVLGAMATGALRGARGNSGLILSVALRGVADALDGVTVLDAPTFAGALELASARARDAVAEPVDGTMLTVLDAMADEARAQADSGADLVELIEAVRGRSRTALRETTGQLDVLFEADIVDAGSTGIVELFDLLYLTITGRQAVESAGDTGTDLESDSGRAGRKPSPRPGFLQQLSQVTHTRTGHAAEATGLELVFHLGDVKDRTRIVKRLLAKARGTSVVVSWPMVHVHVADEQSALQVLVDCGEYGITDLRVEDLSLVGGRDPQTVVIALASGVGLLLACALQEVIAVDSEAPGVDERIAELAEAQERPVILVPDSGAALKRLRDRCERLPEGESDSTITLVRSRSVAAVLSALAVYDPAAEFASVLEDMSEAAAATRIGAVVQAESGSAGPLIYQRGDLLTVIDGRVRAVDTEPEAAVMTLADRLLGAGGELLTVITGARLPANAVTALLNRVRVEHPDVVTEVVHSLHPRGCAVLGVE
ncbi:DAK2 domain-containing protein [Brevibacterium daeguense]|uniref:DAK2 domain-containing protein n=1 Tax=Brevibacterium daeguense TaxID=909936 RepID=A0ABP8ELN8_9MICO